MVAETKWHVDVAYAFGGLLRSGLGLGLGLVTLLVRRSWLLTYMHMHTYTYRKPTEKAPNAAVVL